MHTVGRRFAHALSEKDVASLTGLLADDVDFKGLTPQKFWEAQDRAALLEILLGVWFAPQDEIEAISDLGENSPVGDIAHVAYRFTLRTPDGPHLAEQHAYYRTSGEQISYLRILCSGFRPAG